MAAAVGDLGTTGWQLCPHPQGGFEANELSASFPFEDGGEDGSIIGETLGAV